MAWIRFRIIKAKWLNKNKSSMKFFYCCCFCYFVLYRFIRWCFSGWIMRCVRLYLFFYFFFFASSIHFSFVPISRSIYYTDVNVRWYFVFQIFWLSAGCVIKLYATTSSVSVCWLIDLNAIVVWLARSLSYCCIPASQSVSQPTSQHIT